MVAAPMAITPRVDWSDGRCHASAPPPTGYMRRSQTLNTTVQHSKSGFRSPICGKALAIILRIAGVKQKSSAEDSRTSSHSPATSDLRSTLTSETQTSTSTEIPAALTDCNSGTAAFYERVLRSGGAYDCGRCVHHGRYSRMRGTGSHN